LRLVVGVAHVLDNSGEEQRDRVKGSVDTDGDQHVDVDLPVLEGGEDILVVELVGEGGAILLESGFDFVALILGQKFGTKVNAISKLNRI